MTASRLIPCPDCGGTGDRSIRDRLVSSGWCGLCDGAGRIADRRRPGDRRVNVERIPLLVTLSFLAAVAGLFGLAGFAIGRASASVPRPAPQPMASRPVEPAAQREAPSRSPGWVEDLGASPSPEPASPPPAPVVRGIASWYDDGPGLYAAAGRGFRKGEHVRVCHAGTCLRLRLVDVCACHRRTSRERVIDLSHDAFARLAPLSAGLIRVSVTEVRR